MLLGGDYTSGVKGVGIVNGMEIMQAYPELGDDVMNGLDLFKEWLNDFDNRNPARNLFDLKHHRSKTRWIPPKDFPSINVYNAYAKPVVDVSNEKFSWNSPDMENLYLFCREKLGWIKSETDRLVAPVLAKLGSRSRQTRLESYLMKYDDNIKFANVKSKRLKEALQKMTNESLGINNS